MSSRVTSWNGFETTLDGGINNSTTAIILTSVDNLSPDTFLIIDPDKPSIRDFVYILSIDVPSRTLTVRTRPEEGSTGGTGHAHDSGATVRAVAVHQWMDLAFDDIEQLETDLGNHVPGTDPHPQYLTEGEGDALYLQLAGGTMAGPIDMGNSKVTNLANPTVDDDASTKQYVDDEVGIVAVALVNHEADPDAHHAKYTDGEAVAAVEAADTYYTKAESDAITDALDARITALESGAPPESHTHNADDVDTGVLADARIPNLNASKTNAGTFTDGRIPNLNASKVTAGEFTIARIPKIPAADIIVGQLVSGAWSVAGGTFTFLGSVGIGGPFNANSTVDFQGLAINAGGADLRIVGNSVHRSA